MVRFKPQITYETNHHSVIRTSYPTYAALKRDLREHLANSLDNEVSVARYRRGEWGEWFEVWTMYGNGKLKIIREGWM